MAYTFSKDNSVKFSMDEKQFRELLTGNIVLAKSPSGEEVEFFLADIGIAQMEKIFSEEMQKHFDKLFKD